MFGHKKFVAVMFGATLFAPVVMAEDVTDFRAIGVEEAAPDTDLAATLLPIEAADPASFAKGSVKLGDVIGFELSGIDGASIYILNMDSAGEVRLIFPNSYDDANSIEGADTLTVPAAEAKYSFRMVGEPGAEYVKVLAVWGDVSAMETMLYEYFDKQEPFPKAIKPVAEFSEGLAGVATAAGETQFAEVTIEYEIVE